MAANPRRCSSMSVLLMNVVFISCLASCGLPPKEYRLRDSSTGHLSEPFRLRKNEVVRLDNNYLLITEPRSGELETIDKLRSINVSVVIDGQKLPQAVETLMRSQRESVGAERAVPIFLFVGSAWLESPDGNPSVREHEGRGRREDIPEMPKVSIGLTDAPLFDVLLLIQEMVNDEFFSMRMNIDDDGVALLLAPPIATGKCFGPWRSSRDILRPQDTGSSTNHPPVPR